MTSLRHRERDDLAAGGAAIADLAIARDGATLAVAFARTVLLAPWAGDARVLRFEHDAQVEALAFSPDGSQLAFGSDDGRVCLLDSKDARVHAEMRAEHGCYYELAWSSDGKLLAGAHYDPVLTLFDASAAEVLAPLDPTIPADEGRTAVAFGDDGSVLVSTAANSIVQWTLPRPVPRGGRGVRRRKFGLEDYLFFIDVAFSPDRSRIAALAEVEGSTALLFFEMPGGKRRRRLELPRFSQRLAWSADGAFVAVAENDEPGLSLWNPVTLAESEVELEPAAAAIGALAAHPRRVALAAGSGDGRVYLWEARES